MNAKPMACDDRQLLAILRSEEGGAGHEQLMQHVERCSHCQLRLEELAARPDEWKKVSDALNSESWDNDADDADGDCSRFRYSRWIDCPVSWTESMAKQLLSPPSHPEMLGRLGRYEVERMVGAGGMGIVFKAFDSELNRPVAVKVLAPYLAGSGPARKRFAREARAAAAIVHEHVVPIYNVETERDTPFLVMQYIAGESLQSRIDRSGPLQTCETLRIGMQIASGLSAAHQQGIVHRDIKPSNVLLEQGVERALISDFGLALAVDDATLTRSGFHPGTPQFMSPEQASGDAVDARSDLFSLGSVLYTMCAGRPPFRAETSLGVLRRIADGEPRRIREVNPNVPEWLCGIIGKLMQKSPSDRYRTAADVAVLLEQCLAHVQQPEFIPLPDEANKLLASSTKSSAAHLRSPKARLTMTRMLVTIVACAGMFAAFWLQAPSRNKGVASLQGEWLLIAAERDGVATPQDQLFNERLVIDGARFSRHQTAPNGKEIDAEKGRLWIDEDDSTGKIDFVLFEGTVHGLYKRVGDKLTLCITRQGGPRPDSFQAKAGDSRVLQTFRQKKKPANDRVIAQAKTPPDFASRGLSSLSRPVMAENAPIVACIGPEQPVRLGDIVSHAAINAGLDHNVVRLHVWDWSQSDLSRVLLIQRSELGTLSPDGTTMLTQEGETINVTTKRSRQYSGFTVPDGQRITALEVSPSQNYAAAIIHVRTDVENLPTDPPTLDARHFWTLRLLKLDALTNTGHRLGEYAANARAGVAFAADEAALFYSTDQHSIVRRELPTGKILNTYEPSLGVHGAVGLAVSPDGRFVAAAGYHGTIYLWETATGKVRIQQESLRADGERDLFFKAGVLRFSSDGSKLAMASGNHVKILETGTGKIIREHRDQTQPAYVHIHWSSDDSKITLLTSSQRSEYGAPRHLHMQDQTLTGVVADRLPRIYEWMWEAGVPVVKEYLAAGTPKSTQLDPDLEAHRFTGTWRIVDRSTAGVEQTAEIGQTVRIRHRRMGEVRLDLDPNQNPKTVDIVFLEGPEQGKVLRGIYEWIPAKKGDASTEAAGTGEALRICTFIAPHPDRPDERPRGFQAGKDVDTAVWECLSHELPKVPDSEE